MFFSSIKMMMSVQHWRNDVTWTNPGSDLGLHGERPVTNHPSHGTGSQRHNKCFLISISKYSLYPTKKNNNLYYKDHPLNVTTKLLHSTIHKFKD